MLIQSAGHGGRPGRCRTAQLFPMTEWARVSGPSGAFQRFGGRLGLALLAFALNACTAPALRTAVPALDHDGAPYETSHVDTLALTPAMERFLDQYVRPYPDQDTRVQLLATAVSSQALLGFRYDDSVTYTAAEAFEARRGNCVSYANLIVALARASGLRAEFQGIEIVSDWEEREDTLVMPRHINVLIETRRSIYVLDVSGFDLGPENPRQRMSARQALAVYYNNLGAEALLGGELPRAHAYLRLAIETDPSYSDAWTNLGVAYSRNGQHGAARNAYETALAVDRSAVSALSNLHALLVATGDVDEARAVARRVERHRRKNPYHLLAMAEVAMEQERFRSAISLLEQAVRRKPDEARFYLALARAQDHLGERESAEANLALARQLAPEQVGRKELAEAGGFTKDQER
jgi:Flp pilus assembly protein TadD